MAPLSSTSLQSYVKARVHLPRSTRTTTATSSSSTNFPLIALGLAFAAFLMICFAACCCTYHRQQQSRASHLAASTRRTRRIQAHQQQLYSREFTLTDDDTDRSWIVGLGVAGVEGSRGVQYYITPSGRVPASTTPPPQDGSQLPAYSRRPSPLRISLSPSLSVSSASSPYLSPSANVSGPPDHPSIRFHLDVQSGQTTDETARLLLSPSPSPSPSLASPMLLSSRSLTPPPPAYRSH